VRLTVDNAGNAQAHLVAERPETLQMLQRDSATLSHALKESGVQLGDNGLQFSLKGQERQGDGAQQGASRARPLSVSAAPSAQSIHPVSSSYGLSLSRAGIDIRV
jgi:flagellar hook-length control protein FliK